MECCALDHRLKPIEEIIVLALGKEEQLVQERLPNLEVGSERLGG